MVRKEGAMKKVALISLAVLGLLTLGAMGVAWAQGPYQPVTTPGDSYHCGGDEATMRQMMDEAHGPGSYDAMLEHMREHMGEDGQGHMEEPTPDHEGMMEGWNGAPTPRMWRGGMMGH
jgi:hypothetical protein